MSDNFYCELREILDRFPRGFQKTESGVEIKILKKLFSEEDAKLAVQLSPVPEELGDIAARLECLKRHANIRWKIASASAPQPSIISNQGWAVR